MKALIHEERLGELIKSSLSLMCKTSLRYTTEVEIKGLLGITLDKTSVFLVDVKELIRSEEYSDGDYDNEEDDNDDDYIPGYENTTQSPKLWSQKRSKQLKPKESKRRKRTPEKITKQEQNDQSLNSEHDNFNQDILDENGDGAAGGADMLQDMADNTVEQPRFGDSDAEREMTGYSAVKVEKPDTGVFDDDNADFCDDADDNYDEDNESGSKLGDDIVQDPTKSSASEINTSGTTESMEDIKTMAGSFQPLSRDVQKNINSESSTNLSVPKATIRKCKWASRVYEVWRSWSNARKDNKTTQPSLDDLINKSDEQIAEILSSFLMEARKKDGSKYPPKTLYELIISFMKYHSMKGKSLNLFAGEKFKSIHDTLAVVMKDGAKEGLGAQIKKPAAITSEQEEYLWYNGYLGDECPRQLLDTLFWLISANFGVKGRTEQRSLTIKNFEIGYNSGLKYLKYIPDKMSKSKNEEIVYENSDPKRCLLRVFKKYISRVHARDLEQALFWYPYNKPKDDKWFGLQPVGHNVLATMIKTIMKNAGFEGYYTNNSPRVPGNNLLFPQAFTTDHIVTGQGPLFTHMINRQILNTKSDVCNQGSTDNQPAPVVGGNVYHVPAIENTHGFSGDIEMPFKHVIHVVPTTPKTNEDVKPVMQW